MCYLPITWQSRRNVFEHDKDTSFEIAPLVPSKRSANQQVLGRSVKPILPPSPLNRKAKTIYVHNMF